MRTLETKEMTTNVTINAVKFIIPYINTLASMPKSINSNAIISINAFFLFIFIFVLGLIFLFGQTLGLA